MKALVTNLFTNKKANSQKVMTELQEFYDTHVNTSRVNFYETEDDVIFTVYAADKLKDDQKNQDKRVFVQFLPTRRDLFNIDCTELGASEIDCRLLSNLIEEFFNKCEKEGYEPSRVFTTPLKSGVLFMAYANKIEEDEDEEVDTLELKDTIEDDPATASVQDEKFVDTLFC